MRNMLFLYLFLLPIMGLSQRPRLVVPIGHMSAISAVAFSSNGEYVLTGSYDHTAKLWDAHSGKLLHVLEGHSEQIFAVAFSLDGKFALTGSADRTAKLWNLESGEVVDYFGHVGWVMSVAFSPDGKFALTGSGMNLPDNGIAQLWDIASGRVIRNFPHTNFVASVAFSADGASVLTGSNDGKARLWDTQSGKLIKVLEGHTEAVSVAAFSPNGEFVLTGSIDGTAKLWNLESGDTIRAFRGHEDFIVSLAFSPDGTSMVTASHDQTAILWDVQSGDTIRAFRGHDAPLVSVAFSPDGERILTGSAEKAPKLWDVQSGKSIESFTGYSDWVNMATFSPSGRFILTGREDATAQLWDLQLGSVTQSFKGHQGESKSAAFSLKEEFVLTGSYDGADRVWDVQSGDTIKILLQEGDFSTLSPDGQPAFKKNRKRKNNILDVTTGEIIQPSIVGHFLAISPDKKWILSRDKQENLLFLGDLRGNERQRYRGLVATFSPNGKFVLTGSGFMEYGGDSRGLGDYGNVAELWDLQSGEKIRSFKGHHYAITSVAFSPNGEFVLTGSADNTTKIWDIEEGKEIATLIGINANDWVVTSTLGFFDASPGAMKLMHYVVNYRGEWETLELEQLKARYYEPGLLSKLMGYSNERIRPVEDFDIVKLYPKVEAQISQDELRIHLHERNGGIGILSIFINGKEVAHEANPLPRRENAKRDSLIHFDLRPYRNYLLQHPDSTNIISIRAYNKDGWLKSRALHLDYQTSKAATKGVGKPSTPTQSRLALRPKLYVVAIGTSDYKGTDMDLQYADQDATNMALALQSVGSALFSNGDSLEVHCLTTVLVDSTVLEHTSIQWKYAQKDTIQATFDAIKQKAKAEDIIVVYLSGHGVARSGADQTQFYYLTQGVASEESLNDPETLHAYSISTEEFTAWINAIPALKQVLIIDACNSGQLVENVTNKAVALNSSQIRALDRMRDRTGMFLLSGSASDKVSYEASQFGQGLLTYALLQGMRGEATRKDSEGEDVIDVMKLFQHARDEVPRLAASINGVQTPMLGFPSQGASFDIGILDEAAKASIPIANEKPIIIRSNFLNELIFEDDLQLVQRLEVAFRQESRRGAEARMIYVDVNDYPEAYALRGLYRVEEGKIRIKLRLFKGKESKVLGIPPMDTAKELVEEILWEVEGVIEEWEEEKKKSDDKR